MDAQASVVEHGVVEDGIAGARRVAHCVARAGDRLHAPGADGERDGVRVRRGDGLVQNPRNSGGRPL